MEEIMPTPLVIDLSHNNNVVNWNAIAGAGIRGVIHKATEGVSVLDHTYDARREAAVKAGLLWGAYHFLRPGDMKAQAAFFLRTAKPDATTLVAADHEDTGVSLDNLKVFLAELTSATGRSPVVYSGHVIKAQLGDRHDAALEKCRLWLAQYTTGEPAWPDKTWAKWWLWQFTDQGATPGITGHVDHDAYANAAGNLAAEWSGGTPAPAAASAQTPVA
jgi:lysozyme